MKKEYFFLSLFFLMVGIVFFLFYKLIEPFVIPIAWGVILTIIFYPLYLKLNKKLKSPGLCSVIMCVAIFVLIIGPAIYLLAALVGEAGDAFTWVDQAYQSGQLKEYFTRMMPFMDKIQAKIKAFPQLENLDFETVFKNIVGTVTAAIGAKAAGVIANISKTIFQFFLTLFAMYFFFRDGEKLVQLLKRLTPLNQEQTGLSFAYLKGVVEGTMYGGVVMALIQGTLGGILFAIMGIDSAIFWGAVMGFLSFLPILGPFLIYIPAGLILIVGGSPVKGILIIAIGVAVISQIDNFVRPLLFRGKTQMHTLLMFFSIMGGIALFGLVGIALGPLIAALFLLILKIFELKIRADIQPDYLE
jgi:predicted PurR-regulated permease PerM